MHESNPMLLRRMLALRQFPMFATTELAELAVIAQRQARALEKVGRLLNARQQGPRGIVPGFSIAQRNEQPFTNPLDRNRIRHWERL